MNDPADSITEEIRGEGPMTLARFMYLALYLPGCGYYERERQIGRGGDFQTSVSVGSLFGELLAFQFTEWLEAIEAPRLTIIEAGAHDGRLAVDILDWMRRFRPGLFERVEYWFSEASPTRRGWQERTLEEWAGRDEGLKHWKEANARWMLGLPTAEGSIHGVIFSNEFFDALPMHRLGWDRGEKRWREWRVAVDGERLVWKLSALSTDAAWHQPVLEAALAEVLPDGYTVEICPKASLIWQGYARCLGSGKILTVDYGLTAEERFRPERTNGTLRAYAAHRVVENVLDAPGSQDITAHIDFSALQAAGEKAGLQTNGLWRQETFLTRIVAQTQAAPERFGPWTAERTRQFQTLTHPQHFGESFRVLAQSARGR